MCGNIPSVFFGVIFFIIPSFIFRYHSSFAILIFSTILLPLRKIVLSYFSQILTNCCTLDIHDENVAIINLPLW
ncbi:hypothetical protein HOG21_06590 [bacterium]|nr:hypothetical protein [bacterium]